jgi:adenylate kinase
MVRVFVNHCDTGLGKALCAALRSFPSGRNFVYGTLSEEGATEPKSVRRVVPKSNKKALVRTLPQCSVVVYSMENSDREELSLILMALNQYDFEKPFTFILVSSAVTWGETPLPEPAEGEEPATKLSDAQFASRTPCKGYESWYDIEQQVVGLRKKNNVETFIVTAGVLFGNGEEALHDLFKGAWLSEPTPLNFLEGDNFVPTCHVKDCAQLVKHIAATEDRAATFGEDKCCFIAVDNAELTQKEIVQGITKHLMDGYDPVTQEDYVPPAWLSLNLKLQASAPLTGGEIELAYPNGPIADLKKVTSEFTKARNLRPICVVVTGPPLVGKSVPSMIIAEHFNLPYVSSASVLQEARQSRSQVGSDLRMALEELRAPTDTPGGGRITDDQLQKVFKWKLQSNACKFRGYVLDGYPRTMDDAAALFLEEEEILDDNGDPVPKGEDETRAMVPSKAMPQFVISLEGSKETLLRRCAQVAADSEKQQKDHNDEQGLERRFLKWEDMIAKSGSCVEFFQDQKIECLTLDIDHEGAALGSDTGDLFEMIRLYMERKGRPNNYLKSGDDVDKERLEAMLKQEQAELEAKQAGQSKKAADTKAAAMDSGQDGERLILIDQHESRQAELAAKPLRPFLMHCAIPALSDALVELCRGNPADPIEFLASYLEDEATRDFLK